MIKHELTHYPNYILKSFKEYNNDIQITEENYDMDAKLHGPCIKWYDDGQIKQYIMYNHNQKNGEYKTWFPNGQLRLKHFYKNDALHGTIFEWYESGELYETTNFVNGKQHGKKKQWYNNGIQGIQIDFINGKRNGIYKQWYPNGQLFSWRTYKDDNLINSKSYPIETKS